MSKFATYEQVAEIAARLERIERAATAKPSTTLAQIVAQSGIDGRITLGDILTGSAAIGLVTFAGLAIGTGAGIISHVANYPVDGPQIGAALGMVVGGVAVGRRTLLDVWEQYTPDSLPVAADVSQPDRFGVDVEVIRRTGANSSQVLRGAILPEMDTRLVVDMLRKVAQAHFYDRKPFSKRGAGSHLGDNYAAVIEELLRLGLLTPAGKSKNAGYKLTHEGREWLAGYL